MPNTFHTCDVLLIGGGVVGLSLAWELASSGAKVQVVDSGELGREASWAAAGMLPPGPTAEKRASCSAYDQIQGLSHELHSDWHERLRDKVGIDNGYRPTGAIYAAESSSSLALHAEEWTRWGLKFYNLDRAGIADLERNLRCNGRATLLPSECQLRPPWHLKALFAVCQKVGVKLTPGCQVTGFDVEDGRVSAAVTPLGKISAGQFCLTSGCWSGQVAAGLGLNLPIRPVRGQILLLNGSPGVLDRIVNVGPRYLTPRADGRVLVGSTQEEVGFNKQNTVEGVAELMNFARRLCPPLADFTLEQSWSGLRPGTADGLPFLGRMPNFENTWLATGHFRAGIQLSPATAVIMRSLILGQAPPVDVAELSMSRICG
jgi:glycine oxidase